MGCLCHLYQLGDLKTFMGRFGIFQLDGILALELSYCLDSASKDSAPVRDENFHPVFSMKLSSIKFSEESNKEPVRKNSIWYHKWLSSL